MISGRGVALPGSSDVPQCIVHGLPPRTGFFFRRCRRERPVQSPNPVRRGPLAVSGFSQIAGQRLIESHKVVIQRQRL